MSAVDAEALGFEATEAVLDAGVGMQWHPLLAALGGFVERARSTRQTHHVGLEHPHGIAGAQDCREVVGLVHRLEHHREIAHAAVEHSLEALKAAGQQGHHSAQACNPSSWIAGPDSLNWWR